MVAGGVMTSFQSLGELSNYLGDHYPKGYVVDPGVPLWDMTRNADMPLGWSQQPSLRKVTTFIARLVAGLPLNLYQRKDENTRLKVQWSDAAGSPGSLAWSLANPSDAPGMSAYKFWSGVVLDGLVFDRWCVAKSYDDLGRLRFTRVPARRVYFETDRLDQVKRVVTYTKDGEKELPLETVVIMHGWNAEGGAGLSPIATLKELLLESREAIGYRRDVWKNGARIPGVIEWEKGFPAQGDQRTRFLNQWSEYRENGSRAGQEPVLEHGMTYHQLKSLSPESAQDLAGRQLTDVEVASAYHIAPELVGAREGNYSNMTALRQSLYRINLGPYITEWEQAVAFGLRDERAATGQPLYLEADREEALRGSFEEEVAAGVRATGAPILTRNEFRAKINRPPIEGGDELVLPLNVSEGGQMPTDAGVQNEKPAGG